jgi:hypothetical protein
MSESTSITVNLDYGKPHTLRRIAALLLETADAADKRSRASEENDKAAAAAFQRAAQGGWSTAEDWRGSNWTKPCYPVPQMAGLPVGVPPRADFNVDTLVKIERADASVTTEAADTVDEEDPKAEPAIVPAPPILDAAGMPWDERIHASTREQNKDGTWRRRRNLPQEIWDSVMAEYASRTASPPPPLIAPTDPGAPYVAPPPPAPMTAVIADLAPPPPMDPAPPPPTGPTLATAMPAITNALQDGRLTLMKLNDTLHTLGVPGLPSLKDTPDLIPAVMAGLGLVP